MESKVSVIAVSQTARRSKKQHHQNLGFGNESPLQSCSWKKKKKGGIGISLFTTPTDKRLSQMMHPASKYKESRQLSRHST